MHTLVTTACLLLAVADANDKPRMTVGFRGSAHTHRGWSRSVEPCSGSEPIRFTVFLKQQNLDVLLNTFNAVSDPRSSSYGKFLTKQQVDLLTAPQSETKEAVLGWLSTHGIEEVEVRADSLLVSAGCSTASTLFGAPFHRYEHALTRRSRWLVRGTATIPLELNSHVDFLAGISELWHGNSKRSARGSNASEHLRNNVGTDLGVTPALLRSHYNVPDGETNESPDNYQAVVAFDDYFSEDALKLFYQNTDGGLGTAPTLEEMGPNCLSNDPPCDQIESDLDVQYMTAMAGQGTVKTLFFNANTTDGWVLGFSENALQLSPMPMVFSLSYGWLELKQCDVATNVCDTLGYTSKQYMDRTNTNFQKMAVMGSSILVSSGDDGAVGSESNGWNPLDENFWCLSEMCYPRTKSQCGEVMLRNTTTGETCVYPTGLVPGNLDSGCSWLYRGDFYQSSDINDALKAANPSCNMEFYLDYDYNSYIYSECACDALQPLAHDDVVSETFSGSVDVSKRIFWADFPTSSPYVTSVGATQFISYDGQTVGDEVAASLKAGAIITSGGGFSEEQDQPSWQTAAVRAYADGSTPKPPAGTYDASKRGYPDISLNGHNYRVWGPSADAAATCPCEEFGVDGTSASSPALAGLVSLINGHLLKAGKSQLGFLNPLLYAAYADEPKIFKDVISGDIKCTSSLCFTEGYKAGEGWDPASGLGTLDYEQLKYYALHGTPGPPTPTPMPTPTPKPTPGPTPTPTPVPPTPTPVPTPVPPTPVPTPMPTPTPTPGCSDAKTADYCTFVVTDDYCNLLSSDCLKSCGCCVASPPAFCGTADKVIV